MKPPPPRLPAAGCVTANANATAIAASTALPPRFIMSTPTLEAISLVEATMPWRARTGSREAAKVIVLCCTPGSGASSVEQSANASEMSNRRRIMRELLLFILALRFSKKDQNQGSALSLESPRRQQILRIEFRLHSLHQVSRRSK